MLVRRMAVILSDSPGCLLFVFASPAKLRRYWVVGKSAGKEHFSIQAEMQKRLL